jgi:hypothetical protein
VVNRLQQKHELYIGLGKLFGPLQHLAAHSAEYDEQEKAETLAQYFADYHQLLTEFNDFRTGQSGYNYVLQYAQFQGALEGILQGQQQGRPLQDSVDASLGAARSAIDAIPVPRTSVILKGHSPFSTYCRLRALCDTDATASLDWIDEYFGESIFHRYLAGVRPDVTVTLVTSEPQPGRDRDRTRWPKFLDTSRLYAKERGPARYRLVVHPDLHDRWVRFDQKRIYSLGGSVKDAADRDYFTIASVDATDDNLQNVQLHIDGGAEWFGPSSPTHR